jgi:ABC-type Co2+ transport system permease subunit
MTQRIYAVLFSLVALASALGVALHMFGTGHIAVLEGILASKVALVAAVVFAFRLFEAGENEVPSIVKQP